jgi:hypothetical protein
MLALAAWGPVQDGPRRVDLPRVSGTEISSETFWERGTDITSDAHTAMFGAEPFRITFSITHRGLQPAAVPESVDLLLVREMATPADVALQSQAPVALAIIDGLLTPLTRQAVDGPDRITATVPFEIFQWMVGGRELEFEAFGRRLVLAARQITFLKQTGLEWAHPPGRR